MSSDWGRFTVAGSELGETAVHEAVDRIVQTLQDALRPGEYRSVLLIGGYGRGEGGIERVDGREVPHNNLDLLVISRPGVPSEQLREKTDRVLAPLRCVYPFGIDVGAIEERRLKRAQCLVMWYDMRYGHKPLLGDPDFVPALERFSRARIQPADVRNLLVNRGTLLVINDLILERASLTETERRTVVRHAIKAIIGYGDALLFFDGRYHWSYQVKRERMQACRAAAPGFRELYDQAAAFRFQPDYGEYMRRDLKAWNQELCARFADIHLACEARRLGAAELDWANYVNVACRYALGRKAGHPRAWVRKLRNCVRASGVSPDEGWAARLGHRCLDDRGRLALAFPFVVYPQTGPAGRETAARLLGLASTEATALRRAYLRAWGARVDPNFTMLQQKLGLNLEEAAAS